MKPTDVPGDSPLLQPATLCKPLGNAGAVGVEISPRPGAKSKLNLMYDFEQEFTLEELADEPTPSVSWVHLSCAFWLPELDFETEARREPVVGFERLDKKRFRLVCSICQQRNVGCCIQCSKGKCQTSFHVECARLAGLFLEIVDCGDSDPVYRGYCERHRPLKLQKTLEQSRVRATEEIAAFCKLIAKSRAPAEKLELAPETKPKKPLSCKLFTKADKKTLLARLKTVCKKYGALAILATRTKPGLLPNGQTAKPSYRLLPSSRKATYADTLRKRQFPWNDVKFGKFTAQDCFQKYIRLVPNEDTFYKMVLGKVMKRMPETSKGVVPVVPVALQVLGERKKYCYCRKMSNEVASQMIGTSSCGSV